VVHASQVDDGTSIDAVEMVNFGNPDRLGPNPALAAIACSAAARNFFEMRALEHLVATKLYAGGRSDLADIEQLLARSPDADLAAIRSAAAAFDRDGQLEALIASTRDMR
jgi:hypothetical protein